MESIMNLNTKKITWKTSSDVLISDELKERLKIDNLDSFTDFDWLFEEINQLINIKLDYSKDQNESKSMQHFTSFSVFGKGNIVEKIIDINVDIKGNQNAFIYDDGENIKEINFDELSTSLSKVVCGLKEIGFKKGDRAIIAMPFIPEALYSFLGVIKMGGVSIPLVFDFSQDEIQKIINYTQAKVLFTVDSINYDEKTSTNVKNTLDEVLKKCPSIEIVIVVNLNHSEEINWTINRDAWWDDLVESQQLLEPIDTTNTGEPHMVFYFPKSKNKSKINSNNLFESLMNSLKEKDSEFTRLFLIIGVLLHNYKIQESLK